MRKGSRKPSICPCGETNPDKFYAVQRSECKKCTSTRTSARQRGNTLLHRARHLKRAYGWSPEKYAEEFEKQKGLCDLCGKPPLPIEPLWVDHDHETGEPRGLIHQHCNSLLGFASDNIEVLFAAVAYIQRHNKKSDL